MDLHSNDLGNTTSKHIGFDAKPEPTTLIAAFSDHLKAHEALNKLTQEGFRDTEAWLVENGPAAEASSREAEVRSTTSNPPLSEEKHGFAAFIDRMFGFDDETPAMDANRRMVSSESTSFVSRAYENKEHLLVVSANPSRVQEARELLLAEGARIDDAANEYLARDFQETLTMRLSEEELVAHTEEVAAGEIVLRKEVVTEMRTIEVPVSHEEVVIERRTIAGQEIPLAESSGIGEDMASEEVRMQLMEEQVTIEKKLVPKEEISVSKRQVFDTKTITEEVRHEEAKVERSGVMPLRNKDLKSTDAGRPSV